MKFVCHLLRNLEHLLTLTPVKVRFMIEHSIEIFINVLVQKLHLSNVTHSPHLSVPASQGEISLYRVNRINTSLLFSSWPRPLHITPPHCYLPALSEETVQYRVSSLLKATVHSPPS